MYKFRDIHQNKITERVLPSEALRLNGIYIENQIEGYRTLSVSGREALSPELEFYETDIRDGSMLKNRRYPARTIKIKYQLSANTNEKFREAFNELGRILNVEEAEMVFCDEPDKFFIGTPSSVGTVEDGKNMVIGEIEFLCADPFKYSLMEHEASTALDGTSVLIDYKGTYKTYPILEADFYKETETGSNVITGKGDCGYVAFFTENEKIIQLGDPEEVDGVEDYEKSQTLINQSFQATDAWNEAAKTLWSLNNGSVLPETVQQMGNIGIGEASHLANDPNMKYKIILDRRVSDAGYVKSYYTVAAKVVRTSQNTAHVYVAIITSLLQDFVVFDKGFSLYGTIQINGVSRTVTLKTDEDVWVGTTGTSVNFGFSIGGLSEETTSISNIRFKVERHDQKEEGVLHEITCDTLPVSKYTGSVADSYFLAASDYGNWQGGWHGPSITRSFQEADNWTITFSYKMCIGKENGDAEQKGAFQVQITDGLGQSAAGIRIAKKASGKTAEMLWYVKGELVYQEEIDVSIDAGETCTIQKSGTKITFRTKNAIKVINDANVVKARKICIAFEKYADQTPLKYNGLYWIKVVKDNCDTFRNVPNKFSANDILEADCKNGEILLNKIQAPDLGALGNDWEDFYLIPGINQIGASCSEWVKPGYRPVFKVRYREVFL